MFPMSFELWIAFTVASAILLVVPGPTVMVVVAYALGRGRSTGWATVPGVTLGDFTAMTVSLLGAGALLSASATAFTVVKLLGAAYLVWLGIKMWRASPELTLPEAGVAAPGRRRMFWNAYIVTALNPKSIIFFVAFLPQFVDPARPLIAQFALLEATFLILAAASAAAWAVLAGHLHTRFRRPTTLRLVNRVGGGFLIGAGLLTAITRRGSAA